MAPLVGWGLRGLGRCSRHKVSRVNLGGCAMHHGCNLIMSQCLPYFLVGLKFRIPKCVVHGWMRISLDTQFVFMLKKILKL